MNDNELLSGALELFSAAENWKRYCKSRLGRHIAGDVLEVGAGIGGTTRLFFDDRATRWVCLEPDPQMAAVLTERAAEAGWPHAPEVRIGDLSSVGDTEQFDAILYIDVLEHIENDADELRRAARHLKPGGRLVVLAPAWQFLFSEFDTAVGHYRRYNKHMLKAVGPQQLRLAELYYLDSFGLLLSLGNRCILRHALPTARQIQFWDRFVVPCSRWIDPLIAHKLGKTVVAVWENPAVGN
jgi:SAM-dependent methyltransferase